MSDILIEISQALLDKNLNFCIYRLPHQQQVRLAIDKTLFTQDSTADLFWVSPFSSHSARPETFLKILKPTDYQDFLKYINQLPARSTSMYRELPREITKEEYLKIINRYITDIQSEKIYKAILSRVIHQDKPQDFSLIQYFQNLSQAYPNTFAYLLSHDVAGTWLGATTELLLEKTDQLVKTVALASTQSRNSSSQYEWRAKEVYEHAIVGEHIEEVFQKCNYQMLSKNGPYNIESGQVVHLKTDYEFSKEVEQDFKKLLQDLHPTPAIGGYPAKKSVDYILQHENYDRAYYCGFLGELSQQGQTKLYVNLRCVQVGTDKLAAYVGGGITADSQAEEEWEETILKSRTVLDQIAEHGIVK